MNILIFAFIFLLGTIIGSFLNVVIYRFNTGRTIVTGRSICMTCNNKLRWYELIPVFSYLIQGGKCRRCKSIISQQYPIVEVLTGLVFALVAFKFLPILYTSYLAYVILVTLFVFLFSLLIVISVYDLRHKIIPDKLVFFFVLISFFSIFINSSLFGSIFAWPTLADFLAGPVLALPFAFLWYFSKGRLMGLGDGKLVLGLGWMLGMSAGVFSIILSFWLGTIVSVALIIFSKISHDSNFEKLGMKSEVPFAPFLIVSAFLTFVFGFNIFTLIKIFSI